MPRAGCSTCVTATSPSRSPPNCGRCCFRTGQLLGVVAHAAAQATVTAVGTRCRKHPPLPGVMATLHTFGRDLTFHVHVHVLCTEGGLRADGVWQPVKLFPAAQYRRLWQHFCSRGCAGKLKGNRSAQRVIGRLYRAVSHRLHRQRDEPVSQWAAGRGLLLPLHRPPAVVGAADRGV